MGIVMNSSSQKLSEPELIFIQANRDKVNFFVNDLVAAAWVTKTDPQEPACVLVKEFMDIHEIFLNRIGRSRRELFARVKQSYLVEIVRGWIQLYRLTLSKLRSDYPCGDTTPNLIANGVNWSEALGVSAMGLVAIDHASRYAEFWAERSVSNSGVYESLGSRMAFVNSHMYHDFSMMVREGHILVLDCLNNGVTSFDLLNAIKSHSEPDLENFNHELRQHNWKLIYGDDSSIMTAYELATKLSEENES